MIAALSGVWAMCFVWTLLDWVERRRLEALVAQALHHESDFYKPTRARKLWGLLSGRTARERQSNNVLFPDFLDLLALGLSAGLALEQAWDAAVRHLPESPLSVQLKGAQSTWRLGRSRTEAIHVLRERLNDSSLAMTLALISQALSRGGALQDVLRAQARSLRKLRFLSIEKRAQTAGLRLLVPIFLFIFPTVFLILFAPLVIRMSQGFPLF